MTGSSRVETGSSVEKGGPVSCRVEHELGRAIVVVSGEVDLNSAPVLRRALAAAATLSDRIIVDLTAVAFMDSTALGAVLRARGRGPLPSISLVRPPQVLRTVLRLTSLGELLPVYSTRRNAIDGTAREHVM